MAKKQPSFEDFEMEWRGDTFTLPAQNALQTIAQIEGVLTLPELAESAKRNALPMARMSMAYGILLRSCGCTDSDERVYHEIASKGLAFDVAIALLKFMAPPVMRSPVAEEA